MQQRYKGKLYNAHHSNINVGFYNQSRASILFSATTQNLMAPLLNSKFRDILASPTSSVTHFIISQFILFSSLVPIFSSVQLLFIFSRITCPECHTNLLWLINQKPVLLLQVKIVKTYFHTSDSWRSLISGTLLAVWPADNNV